MLYADAAWEPVEVIAANDQAEVTLKGKTLAVKHFTETEVYIDYADWIECGLSGSGIYDGDKLLAVLSRIKRGEYAVGVLVAPYAKEDG